MLLLQKILAWIVVLSLPAAFVVGVSLAFGLHGAPPEQAQRALEATIGFFNAVYGIVLLVFAVVNVLVFRNYNFTPKFRKVAVEVAA